MRLDRRSSRCEFVSPGLKPASAERHQRQSLRCGSMAVAEQPDSWALNTKPLLTKFYPKVHADDVYALYDGTPWTQRGA